MASIASLVVDIGADVGGALRGFGQVETRMGALVAGVGRLAAVGIGAIAAGAAAATVPLVAATRSAANLEQAVANIASIQPDVDTGTIFRELNDMSTRVPQTAEQLADALYNIFGSIDIGQDAALRLTEMFARGASAAQTDAQTFGTAILGVMNAYNLTVADAEHISDVFFNTVARGVVSGQQLASGLGPVVGVAKLAGVGLDTLGGLIVGVTKQGGDASQNINNLSNFLAKLNSEKAVKGFGELGVELTDANGNFRDITAVLADAKSALNKLSPAAKNAAINEIFPDFQARAGFNTLMDRLGDVTDAIRVNRTQAGAAGRAYGTIANTFNTQWQLLLNTFGQIMRTIGAELLPVVTPLVIAFRDWLPSAMETARAVIAVFTTHVGALGIVLANLRQWFGDTVADGIEPFFQAFMQGGWGQLGALVVQRVQDGLRTAWTGLTTFLGEQWAGIDWSAVLAQMGGFAGAVATWLGQVWAAIDWEGIFATLRGWDAAFNAWLLEQWNKLDFTALGRGLGEALGRALAGSLDYLLSGEFLDQLNLTLTALTGKVDYGAMGREAASRSGAFVEGFAQGLLDPTIWAPVLDRLYAKGGELGMALLRGLADRFTGGLATTVLDNVPDWARGILQGGVTSSTPLDPNALRPTAGGGGGTVNITAPIIGSVTLTGEADEDRLGRKVIGWLREAQQQAAGAPPASPGMAGAYP